MNNELKIKPLLKYEVFLYENIFPEVFTADSHTVEESQYTFYRTGNIIRQYFHNVSKIVITPEEDG
jgi:hypothetical protein